MAQILLCPHLAVNVQRKPDRAGGVRQYRISLAVVRYVPGAARVDPVVAQVGLPPVLIATPARVLTPQDGRRRTVGVPVT